MTYVPKRIDMTAHLEVRDRVALEGERRPRPSDELQLAELMLSAYRGSVDEEEETIEQALSEIRKTFAGEHGPFLPDCSRVVVRERRIVSAILVTGWQERPLVAYAMTAPAWKRRGLARAGMVNTMQDVLESGEKLLSLVVTVKNEPAYSLYQDLGFVSGR
jgi:ribosomal protein S18 acetylase RimI-like enzyme